MKAFVTGRLRIDRGPAGIWLTLCRGPGNRCQRHTKIRKIFFRRKDLIGRNLDLC